MRHKGEIDIFKVQEQLEYFLDHFHRLVETFRRWLDTPWSPENAATVSSRLAPFGPRSLNRIAALADPASAPTRFRAYNDLTHYATHNMRTANTAFRFLEATDQAFQRLDGSTDGR